MYVGNKQDVAAHSDRGNPAEGDQDGTEISVSATTIIRGIVSFVIVVTTLAELPPHRN